MVIWSKYSVYVNFQTNIYLLKLGNGKTRTTSEIYSKLTIKTLERRQWARSSIFILTLNRFHIVLEFPLLTLSK